MASLNGRAGAAVAAGLVLVGVCGCTSSPPPSTPSSTTSSTASDTPPTSGRAGSDPSGTGSSGEHSGRAGGPAVHSAIAEAAVQPILQLHADIAGLAVGGLPPQTFRASATRAGATLRAQSSSLRGASTSPQLRAVDSELATDLSDYAAIATAAAHAHAALPGKQIRKLRVIDQRWRRSMSELQRMNALGSAVALPSFSYPQSVPPPPK